MIYMAQDLYKEGYDVYVFEDTAVTYPWGPGNLWGGEGTGAALDTVANAINNQGVMNVAIFGHSHGGAATYWLARGLANARTASTLGAYALQFTGYVDTVRRGLVSSLLVEPEIRRPWNTGYHFNQFQLNSFVQGASMGTEADENQNRSILTIGPANQPIDHFTIPNHQDVQQSLLGKLRARVPK